MAAFIAKQMVGSQLSAVKGKKFILKLALLILGIPFEIRSKAPGFTLEQRAL